MSYKIESKADFKTKDSPGEFGKGYLQVRVEADPFTPSQINKLDNAIRKAISEAFLN